MPVYDASLNVAARFAFSRFEGIVEGQGDPEMPLRMRFIARRAMDEINHGDLVTTSGIGKIYPPDISIGRVSGMVQREYEATMEAELESLIDFSRLEYVFVIEEISEERDSDD
jgi:rod shape-determining protein MreC